MCYNRDLFTNYQSLTTVRTAETKSDEVLAMKDVEFIQFELNIDEKRIMNIITDVEYVSDLNYNLIFTDVLKSKSCEIIQKKNRMYIVDEDDSQSFMTEIRQHESEGNFYILDF